MTTNSIFTRIMAEMPPGLEKTVMLILADGHIGQENRISKRTLYARVAVIEPQLRRAALSTLDRQVRKTIEQLQLQGYPILSDSGQGGYWLGRRSEVAAYLSELQSRLDSLTIKVRALRQAEKLSWIDPPKPPTQQRLW